MQNTTVQKELGADEFKKIWNGEQEYKLLKSHNDSRFGDIQLLKNNKTGEVIFVKEKIATSKKDATQTI